MAKLNSFIKKLLPSTGKTSYAQYGEDLIVQGIFDTLNLPTPRYIDIGAHHPTNLSNTYLFYKKGSSGVCIEPSPTLYETIKKARPRDICLNVGVSDTKQETIPYYVLTAQTMNTFSKEDAEKTISAPEIFGQQKIEKIEKINIVPIKDILAKYLKEFGDFLSIDTEGFDEKILNSIDFTNFRPKVICVETLEQNKDNILEKNTTIINFLKSQNYFMYADTYVNTIFVDKNLWKI